MQDTEESRDVRKESSAFCTPSLERQAVREPHCGLRAVWLCFQGSFCLTSTQILVPPPARVLQSIKAGAVFPQQGTPSAAGGRAYRDWPDPVHHDYSTIFHTGRATVRTTLITAGYVLSIRFVPFPSQPSALRIPGPRQTRHLFSVRTQIRRGCGTGREAAPLLHDNLNSRTSYFTTTLTGLRVRREF